MSIFSDLVTASTVVRVPPARVWRVLTEMHGWQEWNPYYPRAVGELVEGGTLHLDVALPSGRTATSAPRVAKIVPERTLRWTSRFLLPGLLDADHRFRLVREAPGRTRLDQTETLTGVIVALDRRLIEDIRQGCLAMGEALKDRAESED